MKETMKKVMKTDECVLGEEVNLSSSPNFMAGMNELCRNFKKHKRIVGKK